MTEYNQRSQIYYREKQTFKLKKALHFPEIEKGNVH